MLLCRNVPHYAVGVCVLADAGTPYQNNMDELYSIVQFVAPNFLGTLAQFKVSMYILTDLTDVV